MRAEYRYGTSRCIPAFAAHLFGVSEITELLLESGAETTTAFIRGE